MGNTLGAFLWAEAQEESGGRYLPWPGGNTAIGKYQVMPENVANWTKQALGYSMTPQQFADSPQAQEAVAAKILGGYYSKYGPAGAAAAWFSGSPNPNSNASDGNTTVRNYVANVLSLMNRAPASASTGPLGATSGTVTDGVDTTVTDASSTTKPNDKPAGNALWSINLPVIGQTTILTKGQGRAITGALLLVSAVVVGGAGVIILAAYGLKKSGAVDAAAASASVIPGAGGLAGKLASGAQRVKAAPKPRPRIAESGKAKAADTKRRSSERAAAEKKGELPG